MTCSEVGAAVGFPNSVGGQKEAWVLPRGQEVPAAFEQVGAEEAAEETQPEASVVPEGRLDLSMSPGACSGLQGLAFRQMPGPGSEAH